MLMHPTINQLRELKLDGMADAFVELQRQDNARDLGHAEWLALLLDRETASRNNRRFETRLKAARLRHGQASIEDVDYRVPRKLDKALFQQPRDVPLDRRAPQSARHRPVRRRQVVAELRAGAEGLPRRASACTTPACRACSPISSSRTATAASHACSAR